MKLNILRLFFCAFFFLMIACPSASAAGPWYIRAGAGLEKSLSAQFNDLDSSSTNNYFGKVQGRDGRPIGAYGDFGTSPAFEAAVGKHFLDWLRADLSLAYRPKLDFSGTANFAIASGNQPVSGDGEAWTGMVNGFLEISDLFKLDTGIFKPYLGGGAGISYNRMGRMSYLFPDGTIHKISITPPGYKADFAYMVTLGTGIRLSRDIVLDLSYRYSDLGRMETASGHLYLDYLPAGVNIDGTWARLRTHGFFLGFRYNL